MNCIYCGSSDTVPIDFGSGPMGSFFHKYYPDARECRVCDCSFDPAVSNRPPPILSKLTKIPSKPGTVWVQPVQYRVKQKL